MMYYDYYKFCLNPLGFDRLFIPRSLARGKGCVQPHLFASYLRLRVSRVGGEYAYWLL
jgi:hypothetical protein